MRLESRQWGSMTAGRLNQVAVRKGNLRFINLCGSLFDMEDDRVLDLLAIWWSLGFYGAVAAAEIVDGQAHWGCRYTWRKRLLPQRRSVSL